MKVLVAAGLLVLMTSCTQVPHDTAADVQAIKDNEAQWNKDYESRDVEKLIAHYADDPVLMVTGSPPAVGRDAVRGALKELATDPLLSLKFQASRVDVASSGDLAWSQGSYTLTATDPATKKPAHDSGSYVTTYKKQADGSWKAVADIASSGAAPAKQ